MPNTGNRTQGVVRTPTGAIVALHSKVRGPGANGSKKHGLPRLPSYEKHRIRPMSRRHMGSPDIGVFPEGFRPPCRSGRAKKCSERRLTVVGAALKCHTLTQWSGRVLFFLGCMCGVVVFRVPRMRGTARNRADECLLRAPLVGSIYRMIQRCDTPQEARRSTIARDANGQCHR